MVLKSYIPAINNTEFTEWSEKFLDNKVIFSFKYAKTHNQYCILKSRQKRIDLQAVYDTLWEKEDFTWNTFFKKPKSWWWLARESKTSENYTFLINECPKLNKFWHFYIKNNTWIWRIFWWYDNWIFYIIFIDINWKINRNSHK